MTFKVKVSFGGLSVVYVWKNIFAVVFLKICNKFKLTVYSSLMLNTHAHILDSCDGSSKYQ